jgi:hypothetical protein
MVRVCDRCGGPESSLDFYREWCMDPMGISVFCDEHALEKRRQDRICIMVGIGPIIFLIFYMIWQMTFL